MRPRWLDRARPFPKLRLWCTGAAPLVRRVEGHGDGDRARLLYPLRVQRDSKLSLLFTEAPATLNYYSEEYWLGNNEECNYVQSFSPKPALAIVN